jgi:predicted transposase YdaD
MSSKTKGGFFASRAEKRVLELALEYGAIAHRLGADRAEVARAAGKLSEAAADYYSTTRMAKRRGQRK